MKGWQAPFGEIKETVLVLQEPRKIDDGRQAPRLLHGRPWHGEHPLA